VVLKMGCTVPLGWFWRERGWTKQKGRKRSTVFWLWGDLIARKAKKLLSCWFI